MKKLIAGLLLFAFAPAFANTVKANCVNVSNTDLIEDKTMTVTVSKTEVTATSKKYKISGKFLKMASNGSYMFDGSDIADLADQTDYAYIFVTPALVDGKNGSISFSTRQLGDSEGAWWLTETFSCKPTRQ